MKLAEVLEHVGSESLFESKDLIRKGMSASALRQQLCVWKRAGRILQLRRGLYAVAEPYRNPRQHHPFCTANLLFPNSYVSMESALSHYGMIPEYVPTTVSVTTGRKCDRMRTPLGAFIAQQIQPRLFFGFGTIEVFPGQFAKVATPEKALLDLAYHTKGADTWAWVSEMRLQNFEDFDTAKVVEVAKKTRVPKLVRTAMIAKEFIEDEAPKWVRFRGPGAFHHRRRVVEHDVVGHAAEEAAGGVHQSFDQLCTKFCTKRRVLVHRRRDAIKHLAV